MATQRIRNTATGALETVDVTVDWAGSISERRADASMDFRDFVIVLVQAGIFGANEGLDWCKTGIPPASIAAAIDAMPGIANQAQAYIQAARNSIVNRNDELVTAIATAYNRTPEQVDAVFGIS